MRSKSKVLISHLHTIYSICYICSCTSQITINCATHSRKLQSVASRRRKQELAYFLYRSIVVVEGNGSLAVCVCVFRTNSYTAQHTTINMFEVSSYHRIRGVNATKILIVPNIDRMTDDGAYIKKESISGSMLHIIINALSCKINSGFGKVLVKVLKRAFAYC